MFRLFNKKKTEDKVEQKESSDPRVDDLPFDLIFNTNNLPASNQKDKIYLYKWLKSDGDWVDEGKPLYQLRVGEKISNVSAFTSQNLSAKKSGVLQQHKKKDDLINPGDKIYTIHQKGEYKLENTPSKENYFYYFDKFKYKIPENYSVENIKIKEWNKQDGEFVKQGETVLILGFERPFGNQETINHIAEKDGYLEVVRDQINLFHNQNELIYIIRDYDETRIEGKFVNTPNIITDDFTGKKTLKWNQVGNSSGHSEGITSKSIDNKVSFTFTLNNVDGKDFIVFQFYPKELMLSKGDTVSFLFANNRIIDFKMETNSYKASHPFIEKLYENKVQIIKGELDHLETLEFLKWKITLKKLNQEILGGNEGISQYQSHSNLVTVINKLTKEYRELVATKIEDYKPLLERENLSSLTSSQIIEECYVYLMIDTTNNLHKIGISNKPEWREKTLQSEKPTIVLLASKKFVNRKIAASFEKALHETYSDKRIRGEWFQLDAREIEEIKITLNS